MNKEIRNALRRSIRTSRSQIDARLPPGVSGWQRTLVISSIFVLVVALALPLALIALMLAPLWLVAAPFVLVWRSPSEPAKRIAPISVPSPADTWR